MSYTNSPLVSYTKLSPNHSGQRTHSIDRISPHCVVGQCSVETLGNVFLPTSRQASSNYGIGKDGRVGMYCEEKNRSWCTSSKSNDQRAITIECASDTTHPYAMNEIVYASLIKLCVDICKRNGKNKLIWFGDKDKTLSYEPAPNEMIITVHRWFANKSCPGDWLYSRLGDLANKVTAQLGGTETPVVKPDSTSEFKEGDKVVITKGSYYYNSSKKVPDWVVAKTWIVMSASGDRVVIDKSEDGKNSICSAISAKNLTLKGVKVETPVVKPESVSDVPKTIWDFLKGKGLNDFAVAGIMGNLYAESALNSQNLQQTYEKKLGYTDTSYTTAVDNGSYSNFVRDSAGYGLAQWTYWSRKENLLNFAKKAGKSIGSLSMQLDFLWTELQGYKTVMSTLKSATSVRQVSDVILLQYERPADQSVAVQEKRASYGKTYYDKYAEKKVETPKPVTKPAPKQLKHKEGDIVNFKGTVHYSNASASVGIKVKSGRAKITDTWPTGTHPYHCRAVDEKGNFVSGVHGWVNESDVEAIPVKSTKKSVTEVAKDVIKGLYGNGEARKKKLTAEGYNYAEVQAEVNRLLK